MSKVGLSSPWVNFYRELEALFAKDPEVKVIYDEEKNDVKLYVDNLAKADALAQLLPVERTFGNITITVTVIPANKEGASKIQLFRTAFEGNGAFDYTTSAEGIFTNPIHYVVFANEVVQYFNDDLSDAHGVRSTLYQDIAEDVFENHESVYFCTNVPEYLW